MKTSKKVKKSGGKVFFVGVAVVVVLVVVLWLAVFRVVNLQTTIERPRADSSFSCNDSSPDKVKSCFKDTGSCSGCWGYYNGGEYPKKSGGGNNASCFDNCFKNIKPGNGTYCKTYCAGGGGGGGSEQIKVFVKSKNCEPYPSQLTVRMTSTSNCSACNSTCGDPVCQSREQQYNSGAGFASWPKGSANTKYNFAVTGGISGNCSLNTTKDSSCTIVEGGGTCDDKPPVCTKDSDCASGKVCQSGKCVAGGEVNACWGNSGTNGRCYDCNGDGMINILDFSCFAKHWLEDVL